MRIVIPYRPRYPEVHRTLEAHRFCALVAHRRFGKTVLAINHLIKSGIDCAKERGHFAYVAPFRNQAKAVAWDYLKHYAGRIPGILINESELSITLPSRAGRCKLRLFGADKPDALRGLYFDGVILDEVAQMKPEVWEEIIQPALADRQGYAVFIGTPKGVNLFSRIYHHAVKEEAEGNPDWAALRYPCDQTKALPESELARLREELSENKFRQEMLCDFTASSDDILISLDDVNAALARGKGAANILAPEKGITASHPLILGVDIARFGADATVFFPRRGLVAGKPLVLRKKSNTDVAQRLVAWIADHKPRLVNIDQGQGTGVIDIVRDICARNSVIISEIPFGSKALDDRKYFNRRSEIWYKMREWLQAGACLPASHEEILRAELTSPTYSFDAQGRIKLEAKEEIRKRLDHSTDLGDALALTFAIDAPADENLLFADKLDRYGRSARHGASEWLRQPKRKIYDPFK